MKRTIILVVCLLAAGVVRIARMEVRRGQEAAREQADMAMENARTSAAIKAAERRLHAAERDAGALRSALEARAKPAAGAAPSAPSASASNVAVQFKKYREREKDPKVQATRLASWRARLMTSHGVFFRRMGLNASQVERFQNITARRWEQNRDLDDIQGEMAAAGNATAEMAAAVARLKDQVKAECEAAQREVLGDAGYQALQDYERTVEMRTIVSKLAGTGAVTGMPFTPAQAEQLTQILANASRAYRGGGAAVWSDVDWRQADEQARGVLSAPQMIFIQTVAPPLSGTDRFMSNIQNALAEAVKAEAERKQPSGAEPSGG